MSSGSASANATDHDRALDMATRVKGWRDGPELVEWLEMQVGAIRGSERVRVAAWLYRQARAWEKRTPYSANALLFRNAADRIQRGEMT